MNLAFLIGQYNGDVGCALPDHVGGSSGAGHGTAHGGTFINHDGLDDERIDRQFRIVFSVGHGGLERLIQQIGTPIDIYNEPQNRFVAEFIGESNIIEGNMIKDCLVKFDDVMWECVDKGFKDNEEIEVVLRPEDMDID